MKRVIIILLDSVGIGELPDAHLYGDEGSNTLINIKKAIPETNLENMCAMGLGNIDGEETNILGTCKNPIGSFGRMAEKSVGKDTTTGHWEIGGIITKKPFPTFTENGFPKEFIERFERTVNRKTIGNYASSGTEIIKVLGKEHMETGSLIVYTSADSVFQIAAHESIVPLETLYDICVKAREMLTGDLSVARVIARPFTGFDGNFIRTKNRRDFSLMPTGKTILNLAEEKGLSVVAVGKIEDIFEHCGITESSHTTNNTDGIEKTKEFIKKNFEGILFTNLVDYDMLYGHRNDIKGYSDALIYFDKKLPEIISLLKKDDILFITADHGCDPTTPSTDHSREYVPLLVYGKNIRAGINLGTRKTFADLGQTISDYLNLDAKFEAESFLKQILYEAN